jgi:ketosteroid isomerase-like protein
MTHWTEGGGMHEVGPGGFMFVPGGRGGAHTAVIDQETTVFAMFDKGWDRVGVADEAAAATASPPAGAAPWDAALAAEMEAFARGQVAAWEAMDVDRIAATLHDAGLPVFDLDIQGQPVRLGTRDEQLAYVRAMKEAAPAGKMSTTANHCRAAGEFGWCAMDFQVDAPGPDGKPMPMSMRVTGVAARIDGAWKTIHWHGSMGAIPAPAPPPLRGVEAKDLKWQEMPGTGGVKLATVWEDPATRGIAGFVQMPKNWKGFPNHFHSANIHYAVLNGVHAHVEPDGDRRETRAGGWGYEAARNVHRTEGKDGLTLFVVTDGPFDAVPVDEKGNPLPPRTDPKADPKKK